MEAKMGPRAPKIMKNLKREHLKKHQKQNPRKVNRVPILMLKTEYTFVAFWCPFRALGRPGTILVPKPPLRAPGMVPDPTYNDFRDSLMDFWLLFAFTHLSAITFLAIDFAFLFG